MTTIISGSKWSEKGRGTSESPGVTAAVEAVQGREEG